MTKLISPALVLACFAIAQTPGLYSVKAYGATGDGKTLDTASINKAIDAANAAGGGTVYFPPGRYVASSIHLKSNVTLNLEQGSVIEATTDANAYDEAEPNAWEKYQDFGHRRNETARREESRSVRNRRAGLRTSRFQIACSITRVGWRWRRWMERSLRM